MSGLVVNVRQNLFFCFVSFQYMTLFANEVRKTLNLFAEGAWRALCVFIFSSRAEKNLMSTLSFSFYLIEYIFSLDVELYLQGCCKTIQERLFCEESFLSKSEYKSFFLLQV